MINLIPNQDKKKMVNSFYYRLVVVFLIMLSVSFIIASIALLPAYFLTSVKKNLANAKLENQKNEPVPSLDQKTLTEIKSLSDKLSLIEDAEHNKFDVSRKIISEIVLHKMPDIKITKISYQNNSGTNSKVSINGTASSREVLLLFRLALEENDMFKKVDLPISNFIKGSNIQFYLNLTPA